jgi:hypothetical protein
MPGLETPMGLALLLCDTIIEDKVTGKKTLVGLFDRIQSGRFPCVHPTMTIFVSITGGRGSYPCEVVCRHQDNDTVSFSAKGQVSLPDPRTVVDLVFRMNGVRFAKPGAYWLHFKVEDVPIMMRQITVDKRDRDKRADGESGPSGPSRN